MSAIVSCDSKQTFFSVRNHVDFHTVCWCGDVHVHKRQTSCFIFVVDHLSRERKPVSPDKAVATPERDQMVLPLVPMDGRPVASRRLMMLEDRMMQQEMTTRALIDRAIRIKEDLAEYLSMARHTWDGEKRERMLLHDHVETITTTVKRLGRETEGLERDYRDVEEKIHSQKQHIKQIAQSFSSGTSDLRSRVLRCDAGISRLVTELRTCYEKTKKLEDEQLQIKQFTNKKLTAVNSAVQKLSSRIQMMATEVTTQLQNLESFVKHQVTALDSRLSTVVEDLRANIVANHRWSEAERGKLSQQLNSKMDLSKSQRDAQINEFGKRVDSQLKEMLREVQAEKQARLAWEAHMKSQSDSVEARCRRAVDGLRKECTDSFKAVQDSIESMKEVLDAKRAILEEKLEENIRRILKTVVVL